MSRVFVIADLHLGHKKLAELRGFGSTETHDNELVNRWNSIVTKRDTVYLLGDVFKIDRIPELLGNKKLALGNHDLLAITKYLEVFTKIHAGFKYDNCLLTHIPIHPNQLEHRFEFNIHGHMHTNRVQAYRPAFNGNDGDYYDDPKYICVSAEQVNLTPTLLDELINNRRKKLHD